MSNIKEHVAAMPRDKAIEYLEAQLEALEQLPDLKPDQVFNQVELQHLYVDRVLEACTGPHLRVEDYREICSYFPGVVSVLARALDLGGAEGAAFAAELIYGFSSAKWPMAEFLPKIKAEMIAEMQGVRHD